MQRLNGAGGRTAPRGANGARGNGRRAAQPGLALEVLGKFREVYRAAKLQLRAAARPAGVSGAELWALWELRRDPGLRVSDLAQRLSLRQSTVSNLVERLARAKLLSRKRNDPDRRVVRLYLTRAGARAVASAPGPARGALPQALERLPAVELRRLHAQLDRLIGHMTPRSGGARRGRPQQA
jgi:DNA-binding MarR family transcriptional regulator